ncbi:MAG: MerR family transcriptional regulator [Gammaproteobacteria bacterium]
MKELARRTGLNKDTLRFYVIIGLRAPKRDPKNGYKLFNEQDVARLVFICKAKYLGFTLKEIKQILGECEGGQSPCPTVRVILRRHMISNKTYLRERLKLQRRMETAWEKWKDLPDCQIKFEGYFEMIESIVDADSAIENADRTLASDFPPAAGSFRNRDEIS